MCGKFTAMASWREVHSFSQPLTLDSSAGSNDEVVTYTPGRDIPVIVFDRETRERRVERMRWGFPKSRNPYDLLVHARADGIDSKESFAQAFRDGQRGIVVMRTFNEGRDIIGPKGGTSTEQWTIDPQDGTPRGFAFLWRVFEIDRQQRKCCVMVTAPASKLIEPITDRMPAILEDDDWSIWLGEESAELDEVKSVLRTMENVNWKMEREPKKPKSPKKPKPAKPKKAAPEPGLF
jgi:putative SOS response-associated peptidase YedK